MKKIVVSSRTNSVRINGVIYPNYDTVVYEYAKDRTVIIHDGSIDIAEPVCVSYSPKAKIIYFSNI